MADTLELIKSLSPEHQVKALKTYIRENELEPELREKLIYRVYMNKKFAQKKEQGWDEVHKSIKSAPFCEHNQQITIVFFCDECEDIAGNYRCRLCHKKRQNHYIVNTRLEKCFKWEFSDVRCYLILRAAYLRKNPSDKRSPETFRKTCLKKNLLDMRGCRIAREAYQHHLLEFYPTRV